MNYHRLLLNYDTLSNHQKQLTMETVRNATWLQLLPFFQMIYSNDQNNELKLTQLRESLVQPGASR